MLLIRLDSSRTCTAQIKFIQAFRMWEAKLNFPELQLYLCSTILRE